MKSHSPHHSPQHPRPPAHHHPSPHDLLQAYRLNQPDRYSARKMAKPVPFVCRAQHASAVFLVGDFNAWDEKAHPMQRQPDGAWRLEVALNHGHHHYLFLVDGQRVMDPRANGVGRNASGEKVSVVAVS